MYKNSFRELLKVLWPNKKFRIVLLILLSLLLKELIVVGYLGDNTSYIADGYSEANSIRGGHYYADNGFNEYSGLPDLCWSPNFQKVGGFRGKDGNKKVECRDGVEVYTHYPPGSEYLIYPMIKLFGHNLFLIRLQPVIFNFTVILFLVLTVFAMFPQQKAFWASLVLLFPPMVHNYWHGLHHQGYAFSFMIIQILILIWHWHFKKFSKITVYPTLYFIGFLQGWMTFDYAFIASFASLPLFFYLGKKDKKEYLDILFVMFCSGSGFTTSHALHFYQVVGYYGSFD